MIKPIDVGIWQFWKTDSHDETVAVYYCEKCRSLEVNSPDKLPEECPYCKHRGVSKNDD